ncbi:hypothetical protein V5799_000175, partial [Amblyomma americanum]
MDAAKRVGLLDRCWGVPFAVAFSALLLVMVSSCTGYITVLFKDKYLVNHEQASWVSITMVIAQSIA